MKSFRNSVAVFLSFCIFVCAATASAQIMIADHEPFTETFDSMDDGLELPPNWVVSAPGVNANWNDAGNSSTLSYSRILSEAIPLSALSVNWTCPKCGTDRSPGFITQPPQPGVNSFIAHYRNMTEVPLRYVRLEYSIKQYFLTNQDAKVEVSWSKDGAAWTALGDLTIVSGSVTGRDIPIDLDTRYLDSPNVVSAPYNYGAPFDFLVNDIMPTEDFYIRWTFTQSVSSAAQGIGLDDVTVHAYRSEPVCRPITSPATPITEDFDALAGSGKGDLLPQGFGYYATLSYSRSYYSADDGTTNRGGLYSYGTNNAAERAFGVLRSGSYSGMLGACFVNNTGRPITSLHVKYDGETWRTGAASRPDSLQFQYSVDAPYLSAGTWTAVPTLEFATSSSVMGRKDGNLAANRIAGIADTIGGLNIPNGSKFYFRWIDTDATGADDGLAIDNFELTAFVPTAAGVLLAGRVLRPNGTPVSGAVVTVSGGDGSVRVGGRTGTFGQFRFEGLRAGETYFISVRAPRLVFEPETRAVTLNDSVYDLNLISLPETNAARR